MVNIALYIGAILLAHNVLGFSQDLFITLSVGAFLKILYIEYIKLVIWEYLRDIVGLFVDYTIVY